LFLQDQIVAARSASVESSFFPTEENAQRTARVLKPSQFTLPVGADFHVRLDIAGISDILWVRLTVPASLAQGRRCKPGLQIALVWPASGQSRPLSTKAGLQRHSGTVSGSVKHCRL
jgi:hypothetical protein